MATYDVGIIGGGPGGYVAAIRAAQLGGTVYLIEKGEWSGTCLNRGCIPTKTLFSIAHLAEQVQNTPALNIQSTTVDYSQTLTHKTEVIEKLKSGIAQLLKANKIRTIATRLKIVIRQRKTSMMIWKRRRNNRQNNRGGVV